MHVLFHEGNGMSLEQFHGFILYFISFLIFEIMANSQGWSLEGEFIRHQTTQQKVKCAV